VSRAGICIAFVAAAFSLLAACGCPPPGHIDQVFLLDGGGGTESTDCTAAAAGCTPGGACPPACDCVLARAHVAPIEKIDSCTLLAGPAAAQVEVRYQIPTFCGGH
jgi:hypothetical protein